jgi:hypothetical protein
MVLQKQTPPTVRSVSRFGSTRAKSSTRLTVPVTTLVVTTVVTVAPIAETTAVVIVEITTVASAEITVVTTTSAASAKRELLEKEARNNYVNA